MIPVIENNMDNVSLIHTELYNTNEIHKNHSSFTISFIQVVCAIAVVTLHTNGCFWTFSSTERYWVTANIIESVFYFAVPIFFMISGITLLDYQERYSTKEFFRKRIENTLIPYIAWSLIGVIFKLVTKHLTINNLSAKWVIDGLLSTSGIISIYWFFQPLFCAYLCIPLFAAIDKNKKQEIFLYLLICGLILNITIPFFNSILHLGFQMPYKVIVCSEYLFYFIGGYYIWNYPPSKKNKEIIYALSLIGLGVHIVGTYIVSMQSGSVLRTYKGYYNLPCILYSFGVVLLLKDVSVVIEKWRLFNMIINFLGNYTFSLYLIHWFILQIITDFTNINQKSIIYRLFAPYPIFLIVIIFTWCLRKIPGIRKIVP